MDYITLKEAAEKWDVTPRRVNYLCASGRIPGAVKMANIWLIPSQNAIDKKAHAEQNCHSQNKDFSKQTAFNSLYQLYIPPL